jgi:hypothetical protein
MGSGGRRPDTAEMLSSEYAASRNPGTEGLYPQPAGGPGYERYCGPGRAVLRVGGKSFTIKGGNCSGNLNRRSFGLMGYGGLPGKGFWFRLAPTGGRWYVRPGSNTIMDGEVHLPGFTSLPHQGTAIVSKDLKSATFSVGSPPRVTGSWRCR